MLPNLRNNPLWQVRSRSRAFAALGDETRLTIVMKLALGRPHSIAQLTRETKLTRQAMRKHLRVLERAGMVESVKAGRQSLFALTLEPIEGMKNYLDLVSQQWDVSLARLKSLVEK